MFGIFNKNKKSHDDSIVSGKTLSIDEVVGSITENSISGYYFKDLLNITGQRPKLIFGREVLYFEKNNTYIEGASKQVQIQLSQLGLHIQNEVILNLTNDFANVSHTEEFGQLEVLWTSTDYNCSISVHTKDDIFEVSCWK